MVHAPLINNLAVAAAYQLAPTGHPLETAAEMIAAYHEVLPLETAELEILFDLIMTRMVLTVAITGWRAPRYPETPLTFCATTSAPGQGLNAARP